MCSWGWGQRSPGTLGLGLSTQSSSLHQGFLPNPEVLLPQEVPEMQHQNSSFKPLPQQQSRTRRGMDRRAVFIYPALWLPGHRVRRCHQRTPAPLGKLPGGSRWEAQGKCWTAAR